MLLMEKYVYLSAAEEKLDQFVCVHAVPTKTSKLNYNKEMILRA
jgi:hypothetical protein